MLQTSGLLNCSLNTCHWAPCIRAFLLFVLSAWNAFIPLCHLKCDLLWRDFPDHPPGISHPIALFIVVHGTCQILDIRGRYPLAFAYHTQSCSLYLRIVSHISPDLPISTSVPYLLFGVFAFSKETEPIGYMEEDIYYGHLAHVIMETYESLDLPSPSWRPRWYNSSLSPRTWEPGELMVQLMVQGLKTSVFLQVGRKQKRPVSPSSNFVLVRPSRGWVMPTHSGEGNLLYQVPLFKR